MSFVNIEIKARTANTNQIRKFLLQKDADYLGEDLQTDTYFHAAAGRLKLRQGNIENALIFYNRQNVAGPKQSDYDLFPVEKGQSLESLLTKALGVKIIVHKKREIYYIGNVKFHLDTIEGLGNFVEIEATNKTGLLAGELQEQCSYYMHQFAIKEEDLMMLSYSDLLADLINAV